MAKTPTIQDVRDCLAGHSWGRRYLWTQWNNSAYFGIRRCRRCGAKEEKHWTVLGDGLTVGDVVNIERFLNGK